jgi:hypothetical protein
VLRRPYKMIFTLIRRMWAFPASFHASILPILILRRHQLRWWLLRSHEPSARFIHRFHRLISNIYYCDCNVCANRDANHDNMIESSVPHDHNKRYLPAHVLNKLKSEQLPPISLESISSIILLIIIAMTVLQQSGLLWFVRHSINAYFRYHLIPQITHGFRQFSMPPER